MKTVLITGANKGIGKALAQKFLAEGWFVIGTFFQSSPRETMENHCVIELDLSDLASVLDCVEAVKKLGRRIDVLINNAGVLIDEDDKVLVPEKLRETLDVNLIGTASLTERLLPMLSSDAHIVNISSTAGSITLAEESKSHHPGFYPAYKISKAGLNMYTATLAMRLRGENKTVSAVHPGWVRTDMGGEEADISAEEAADDIFKLASARPETGGFWYKGKRLPW